jgi:hypothetical protein
MKLKADRVSGGGTARQPPPLDRALAFFDALLCRRSNSTTSIRGCRASDPSDSCLRPPPWRLRARSPEPRRSRYWSVSEPVAGLRGELAQRLRAHIPELAGKFDLLGDGDAVFGDSGVPNALSSTMLRPFGPKVIGRCEARIPVPSRRGDRAPPPPLLPPRANTGRRRADARLEWSAGPERRQSRKSGMGK